MTWRVINSGMHSAAGNMAVDEAVLCAHAAGEVPPTIRFYGWKRAAVSLGYFQRAAVALDLEECRVQDIAIVRRLTGGRAVLHDAELTYSVVVREDHPLIPATITASYRYFSNGLLAGLKKLGIDARMSMPVGAYGQTRRKPVSAACFDAPAQYEITVQGRKLAGSAQVRKKGVILQHGSILLAFDPVRVASLLNLPSRESKNRVAEILAGRAVSASELLGRTVGWEETCQAMHDVFGPALGIEWQSGQLTAREQALARELAATKYSRDSWNLLR